MNHGVSPKFPHSTFAQSMTCIALTAHEPQDGTSLFSGPERVAWIGWPFGRNTPCYISGHLIEERTLNWDKNVLDIKIYLLGGNICHGNDVLMYAAVVCARFFQANNPLL